MDAVLTTIQLDYLMNSALLVEEGKTYVYPAFGVDDSQRCPLVRQSVTEATAIRIDRAYVLTLYASVNHFHLRRMPAAKA